MTTKFYTDGVHLVTNGTQQDLHYFAQTIGLKRWWYHKSKTGLHHYDLPPTQRLKYIEAALLCGAEKVSPKTIVQILRSHEANTGGKKES